MIQRLTLVSIAGVALGSGFLIGVLAFLPGSTAAKPSSANAAAAADAVRLPAQGSVLFVGDLMFDRYVRVRRAAGAPVLDAVAPLLSRADLNVGNLEGPVTDSAPVSVGTHVGGPDNMRFTFPTDVPSYLAAHRFGLVSIGNNHILDFGYDGAKSTTDYLAKAGVAYVGDPSGVSAEPVIKDVKGVKVAFVAYSAFHYPNAGDALKAIARAKDAHADAIVVLAHWGVEYQATPPENVRELAHAFATAGATLVIGTHPHVIGDREDFGRTRVYYSLGNFVFDQYWDQSVRCGLAVTATFTKTAAGTTAAYEETPVQLMQDGTTALGCS